VNEFLVNLARQRGKLKKGGVADLEAVSKIVLKDWNNGKIPYYVQPPKDERMLGASIVSKFSSEFSVDEIEQEQSEMLKVIRDTAQFGTKVVSLDNTGAQLDVQLETESTEMEDDSDDEEDDDEAPELVPMEEGSVPEFELTKKQKKKSQDKPLKPQRIQVADSELNSQSNKELKKVPLHRQKHLPLSGSFPDKVFILFNLAPKAAQEEGDPGRSAGAPGAAGWRGGERGGERL